MQRRAVQCAFSLLVLLFCAVVSAESNQNSIFHVSGTVLLFGIPIGANWVGSNYSDGAWYAANACTRGAEERRFSQSPPVLLGTVDARSLAFYTPGNLLFGALGGMEIYDISG
jgi:hypothetical protein